MAQALTDKEFEDSKILSEDEDIFIPIDVDWRKTYYKGYFKKRAYAFLLDLITTVPLAIIISIVVLTLYFAILPAENLDEKELFYLDLIIMIIFMFLPFGIMESTKRKGTFGKRIMKIEITDNFGNRISIWRSLWRNILKFLTIYSYMLVFPIFIQYFTYRKSKKLFHDIFSSTIIGEKL